MWESIKQALGSVKEATGIEIPGMPQDLGSIGESANTAVQGLTESATGAVDGVAAAETFTGGAEGVGERAAAVESAGQAAPDLFDELFGTSPLK